MMDLVDDAAAPAAREPVALPPISAAFSPGLATESSGGELGMQPRAFLERLIVPAAAPSPAPPPQASQFPYPKNPDGSFMDSSWT